MSMRPNDENDLVGRRLASDAHPETPPSDSDPPEPPRTPPPAQPAFDLSNQASFSATMLNVASEDGPLTVVSRAYHLDDPHQRNEYEIDTNARKWAEAVLAMWERFGSERDDAKPYTANPEEEFCDRGPERAFQRAIDILNEELERRGLDLEASCG